MPSIYLFLINVSSTAHITKLQDVVMKPPSSPSVRSLNVKSYIVISILGIFTSIPIPSAAKRHHLRLREHVDIAMTISKD